MAEINVFDRISELKKRKAERDSTASVKKGQIKPIEKTAADSVFDMMATTRPAVKTETEEAVPQGRYEKTTNVKERRNEAMAANVSVQTQFDSDLEARRKNLESQGYIVDEFGFIEGRLLSAPPSINKATKQKPWEAAAQADTSDITFDNMDDKIREMLDGTKQTSPVKPTQTVTQQPQTFGEILKSLSKPVMPEFVSVIASGNVATPEEGIASLKQSNPPGSYLFARSLEGLANSQAGAINAARVLGNNIDFSKAPNKYMGQALEGIMSKAGLSDKDLLPAVESMERFPRAVQAEYQDVTGGKKLVGDVVSSVGNMAPSMLANAIIPGLGTAAFAIPAGGNYAREAELEGATPQQQLLYGIVGGTAEALMEKVFVSQLSKLLPKGLQGTLSNVVTRGTNNMLKNMWRLGVNFAGAAGSEAFEEGVTDVVTGLAKKLIYKPEMAWTGEGGVFDLKKIGYDSLVGLLTGAAFASPAAATNFGDMYMVKQYIDDNYAPTVTVAMGLSNDSKSYQMASKLIGEEVTYEKLFNLQEQVKKDIQDGKFIPQEDGIRANGSGVTFTDDQAKDFIPVEPSKIVPEQSTRTGENIPAQNKPVPVQRSYVEELDDMIREQQSIVEDIEYRKNYLGEDVEAELAENTQKLNSLVQQKQDFETQREQRIKESEQARQFEQWDISDYLRGVETTEAAQPQQQTPAVPEQTTASKPVPVQPAPVRPKQTESFDTRYKNTMAGAVKYNSSEHETYTDKPVWEMDAQEYMNYVMDDLDANREEEGMNYDSETPQNKLYVDLQKIEDKYLKKTQGYRKMQYTKAGIPMPKNNYEANKTVLESDMYKKINEYEEKQKQAMNAERSETIEKYKRKIHGAMLNDAIDAGKTIPENILQDYPFLRKKYDIMRAKRGATNGEKVSGTERIPVAKDQTGRGQSVELQGKEAGQGQVIDTAIQGEDVSPSLNVLRGEVKQPHSVGNTVKAYDNDNNEYEFSYALVSADDLISSHDTDMNINQQYPQELQPRDRTRISSKAQIEKMAGSIQPELLGENPKISDGAPIIGPDNIVESGNGRVIALKKMYQSMKGKDTTYQEWLRNNAEKFGLDPDNLPNNPVLVRVRKSDVDRNEFVKKANETSVALMSSTETAKSDAERLNDRILEMFVANEDGVINTADNRPFISAFTGEIIPSNELGRYITPEGYLSQDGLMRVRNAIFYKAYGSDKLLTRISESTDNNIKNITNSLINIAPQIVSVKNGIQKGSYFPIDYASDITAAVEKFVSLKENKTTVEEYLRQLTMLDDDMTASSKAIMYIMEQNSRSAKKLTEFFNTVLNAVEELGNPNQVSIFEDQTNVNKEDVLYCAYRRFEDSGQESFGTNTESKSGEGGEVESILRPQNGQKGTDREKPERAAATSEPVKTEEAKPAYDIKKLESMAKGEIPIPTDSNELESLLREIASIPKDDRIHVDLQLFAKKIRQEISKVYSNTFAQMGWAEEYKDILKDFDFSYDVLGEQEQVDEARDRIEADRQGEIDRLEKTDTYDWNDTNITMELLTDLETAGLTDPNDRAEFLSLAKKAANIGTSGGRQIQAFAKYSRTEAGAIVAGQKAMDTAEKDFEQKSPNKAKRMKKEITDATDALNKADKDSAKQAGAEVDTEISDLSPEEQLAKKIQAYLKQPKPPVRDIIRDMVDELFNVAKESPIEQIKAEKRSPYEFIVEAIEFREKYKQVWDDAKAIIEERYKDSPEQLARLEDYFGKGTRPPFSNKTLDTVIKDAVKKLGINLMSVVTNKGETRKNLINYLVRESKFNGNTAYLFRNFVDERLSGMEEEFKSAVKKDPQADRLELIGKLFADRLSETFAPPQIDKAIKEELRKRKVSISQLVKDYYASGKQTQRGITDYIVKQSGLTGDSAAKLRDYIDRKFKDMRKQYADQYVNKLVEPKQKKDIPDFAKKIIEIANTGGFYNEQVKDLIKQKYGLPTLERADVDAILAGMKKYKSMPDGNAKIDQYDKVMQIIADKMPVTALEKYNAWRRIAMLSSPKTHIRNIMGNVMMIPLRKTADVIEQGLEKAFRVPTEERTKSVGWSQDKGLVAKVDKYWNDHKRELSSTRWEVTTSKGIAAKKPIFKNPTMKAVNDFVFNSLEAEDAWFYVRAYKDALGQAMKARGLTEVNQDVSDYALRKAQEATYKEMSDLASIINRLKKKRGIGPIIEAAMPFTKTPANIAKRFIEYSPLGLAKALYSKVSGQTTNTVIEDLSKGLTGTGVFLLGMLLSHLGWARGERKDSEKAEALLGLSGEQPSSIMTPFGSYTIDWAQPVSAPLMMGVIVNEALKKKDDKLYDTIFNAIKAGGDSIFELSMLQNVKDLLGGEFGSPTEGILSMPGNFVSQAYPTVAGQAARIIDPTRRSTYDTSRLGIWARKQAAKIPGLSYALEPQLDIFGREQKNGGPLEQFISPGYFVAKTDDKVTQEITRMYNLSGETDIIPKVAPRKLTHKGEDVILEPKELTAFQRQMGMTNYQKLSTLFNDPKYINASDSSKESMIKTIVTNSYNTTKQALLKKRGLIAE